MPMLVGGIGEVKAADDTVHQLIAQLRQVLFDKLKESRQQLEAAGLTPVSYKTQVVAGTNFFVKVKVSEGDFVHARIYRDLEGNTTLHSLSNNKAETDEIEYF